MPLAFLVVSIFTLNNYGISWDEPIHFYRGQALFHYFITGQKTYAENKSYYQDNSLSGDYFINSDIGHPPINDILAAGFNYIFYQKLGVMSDIGSLHLFNIISSTLLVFVVVAFAYQELGWFASVVSGLSLGLYPLFFSESHFNIKDPPQTAFFALTIWSFWLSLKKGEAKWLLLSSISFALALGMKFNILFLPFIIGPYLLIRYFYIIKAGPKFLFQQLKKIKPVYYICFFIVAPLIVAIIFFGTWPYLWQDPIGNLFQITKYYKDIGTNNSNAFNSYPLIWIITTTPPIILILSIMGVISAFFLRQSKEKTSYLWLIWFLLPIARVTIPGTVTYGGIRQIMEYIPALALLSGLGAWRITEKLKLNFQLKIMTCIVLLGLLSLPIIKLHPNENVYFNFLIGGLAGAKQRNVPYWGNSFGNAYKQTIDWINNNAEKEAQLALVQGTGLNVPRIWLRADLNYSNSYWSGLERRGEYLMELTYNNPIREYPYSLNYVETFLLPIYEVKADGVAIAKIWKNDVEHTKPELKMSEVEYLGRYAQKLEPGSLTVSLPEPFLVTREIVEHEQNKDCGPVVGTVETSIDGAKWAKEEEPIPYDQMGATKMVSEGRFEYFFPARKAISVKISTNANSCLLKNPKVKIFILKK